MKTMLEMLEKLPTSGEVVRVELSDYAVNTIRGWCRTKGYDMETLVGEEYSRIYANEYDIEDYLTCSREGSAFLLDRKTRVAIFCHSYTRG